MRSRSDCPLGCHQSKLSILVIECKTVSVYPYCVLCLTIKLCRLVISTCVDILVTDYVRAFHFLQDIFILSQCYSRHFIHEIIEVHIYVFN